MLLLVSLTVTACQGITTPYDKYDREGYTVSVKYDANGGSFTTNTTVIVDTANPDELKTGESGKKELFLLAPNDPVRGSGNAFTPVKSGYFLAGWYTERTPLKNDNSEVLDIEGNVQAESGKEIAYTYSGRWDFKNDKYLIDPDKEYTSKEPVLTLYAAWVPEFSFEFYSADGSELYGKTTINPTIVTDITLPKWNLDTGKLENNDVPTVANKTFVSLKTELGGEAVSTEKLSHTGTLNLADATYENNVMKVYVDLADGTWYRIKNATQFRNNASANGCYYIEDDIDFDGKWVSAFNNVFSGTIIGNGHKFTNISQRQTIKGKNNGLFGQITATAKITDLVIDGATYVVAQGGTTAGTNFGLFAGSVVEGATISGVSITASTLTIEVTNSLSFPKDYSFGLVAGLGYEHTGIDYSGITLNTTEGSSTTIYTIEVAQSGNAVTVTVKRKTA